MPVRGAFVASSTLCSTTQERYTGLFNSPRRPSYAMRANPVVRIGQRRLRVESKEVCFELEAAAITTQATQATKARNQASSVNSTFPTDNRLEKTGRRVAHGPRVAGRGSSPSRKMYPQFALARATVECQSLLIRCLPAKSSCRPYNQPLHDQNLLCQRFRSAEEQAGASSVQP